MELLVIFKVLLIPPPELFGVAAESNEKEPYYPDIRGIWVIEHHRDLLGSRLQRVKFEEQHKARSRNPSCTHTTCSTTHARCALLVVGPWKPWYSHLAIVIDLIDHFFEGPFLSELLEVVVCPNVSQKQWV
jgi:hypothetical protein